MRPFAAVLMTAACLAASGQSPAGLREARRAPDWINRLTIYQVWLRSFSPEGNLKGVTERLPYIADLGAGMVYLTPITRKSALPWTMAYSVADYNAIDPEYGTDADLRELVHKAHSLGLKVMLDIVYYHSAHDNNMINTPGFFQRNPDGQLSLGYWKQPLPDFTNPRTRKYLIDSLLHWVRDFDVDGFRCDVADAIPLDFWEEARRALDAVKPDLVMLAEGDRPEDQLQAFDISYNFTWHLTLRSVLREGEPASRLREQWQTAHRTMPRGARLLHYSENHDWRRAVVEFGEKGAMAASVLNFTLDGIPFLFAGQEIADRTPTRHWTRSPIRWDYVSEPLVDGKEQVATLERYKKLFRVRKDEPALQSGEVIWVDNTAPDSVVSFLRKKGNDEILVLVNLSNRKCPVTVDLPVSEFYSVHNLLKDGRTNFPLYAGKLAITLGAFEDVVAKKIPKVGMNDFDYRKPPDWWRTLEQHRDISVTPRNP